MYQAGAAWQRNLGWFSPAEQERLGKTRVAVLGLGGVGGVAAELLARAGVGGLTICDPEVFEASNLNRQLGSDGESLGRPKAEVMARRLIRLNPMLSLTVAPALSPDTAREALAGAMAGVLAVDRLIPALAALRAGRALGVPLVECLALPTVQARCYAPDGPDPEEGLPSQGRPLDEVDAEALGRAYLAAEAPRLGDGQGGPLALAPEFSLAMARGGAVPSLGPVVWLAGAAAALETLKLILGRGRVAWWPQSMAIDPWDWHLAMTPPA